MRIAFTGAGGTGKTTLAKQVSESWGLKYLTNTARNVMKERGIANEAAQSLMSDEALLDLQWAIFSSFKNLRETENAFVSDRLILDNYVYALRRCGSAMSAETRQEWEQAAIEDIYKMDLVFYCPAGMFPLVGDGVRQVEVAHQYLIDSAIYGLLCKHAFDRMSGHVYIVNMADPERRIAYVNALVSEIAAQEQ
jgi:nicotinamide riboside kinase